MNERIQQLAMQANSHRDNFFDLNYKELDVFLEKFAELIVRESVATLEHRYKWAGDADGAEVKKCIAQIKQHFGVE